MAIDDFANCYANHVGTTVDAVIDDLRSIGSDQMTKFLVWFRGLGDADRALVLFLAGSLVSVLLKILNKAVGQTAAAGIVALLGGASWALLVKSCLDCEGSL